MRNMFSPVCQRNVKAYNWNTIKATKLGTSKEINSLSGANWHWKLKTYNRYHIGHWEGEAKSIDNFSTKGYTFSSITK